MARSNKQEGNGGGINCEQLERKRKKIIKKIKNKDNLKIIAGNIF